MPLSKIFTSELPELSKEDLAQLKNLQAVRTTPRDERFPSTNQALNCWNRYNEWIVCTQSSDKCKPMRQYAESICPGFWVEKWDDEREEGTFNGVGNTFAAAKAHH